MYRRYFSQSPLHRSKLTENVRPEQDAFLELECGEFDYDYSQSLCLRLNITYNGPDNIHEEHNFKAVVDTGYSGFINMTGRQLKKLKVRGRFEKKPFKLAHSLVQLGFIVRPAGLFIVKIFLSKPDEIKNSFFSYELSLMQIHAILETDMMIRKIGDSNYEEIAECEKTGETGELQPIVEEKYVESGLEEKFAQKKKPEFEEKKPESEEKIQPIAEKEEVKQKELIGMGQEDDIRKVPGGVFEEENENEVLVGWYFLETFDLHINSTKKVLTTTKDKNYLTMI